MTGWSLLAVKTCKRAELIAALSAAEDMIAALLKVLDHLADVNEKGSPLTPADIARRRKYATLGREALAGFRQRFGIATIEPPRRVQ